LAATVPNQDLCIGYVQKKSLSENIMKVSLEELFDPKIVAEAALPDTVGLKVQ
jgi:hypothetical protein